jgi:hypothetical protein
MTPLARVHDEAGKAKGLRFRSAITTREATMVSYLFFALFIHWVWRKVCTLLEDQDRIDRFNKWFPFTKYPRWRKPKKSYRR